MKITVGALTAAAMQFIAQNTFTPIFLFLGHSHPSKACQGLGSRDAGVVAVAVALEGAGGGSDSGAWFLKAGWAA